MLNTIAIFAQLLVALLSKIRGDGRFFHDALDYSALLWSRSYPMEIIFFFEENVFDLCSTNFKFKARQHNKYKLTFCRRMR